jgi:hypothetical protein
MLFQLIKCMTNSERIPQSVGQWCAQIHNRIQPEDAPAADLVAIAAKFVNLYASTKEKGSLVDSSAVAQEASQLEIELDQWEKSLPENWHYSVVKSGGKSDDIYDGHFHLYRDLWTARVWNNYRLTRIRVNEMFLVHADLLGNFGAFFDEDGAQRSKSLAMISKLAEDVCGSVSSQFRRYTEKEAIDRRAPPVAGVFLILYPLAVASSAIGVSKSLHEFAVRRLEAIGKTRGIQQALIMAAGARIKRARWQMARMEGIHVGMSMTDWVARENEDGDGDEAQNKLQQFSRPSYPSVGHIGASPPALRCASGPAGRCQKVGQRCEH